MLSCKICKPGPRQKAQSEAKPREAKGSRSEGSCAVTKAWMDGWRCSEERRDTRRPGEIGLAGGGIDGSFSYR